MMCISRLLRRRLLSGDYFATGDSLGTRSANRPLSVSRLPLRLFPKISRKHELYSVLKLHVRVDTTL